MSIPLRPCHGSLSQMLLILLDRFLSFIGHIQTGLRLDYNDASKVSSREVQIIIDFQPNFTLLIFS